LLARVLPDWPVTCYSHGMFKRMANCIWAFDAEWVPDPEAGRLLYALPDTMHDREVIAAMWQQAGATEAEPQPFLKLALCRVVSIAAVMRRVRDGGRVQLELLSLPKANTPDISEAAILSTFLQAIGTHTPQLVGYNSHRADLKIMIQRGIIHGLHMPAFCRRPEKPWEGVDYFARYGEDHLDLQALVSSFGKGTPSLHELAVLSGIPGKLDVAGANVAQMWLDGDIRKIVAYNETDALTTYLLWLRVAHFIGLVTTEQYGEEQALVRQLIADKVAQPDNAHLRAYLESWDKLQARKETLHSAGYAENHHA
jgi:predicted PolB exonuclease-like 3'-5' exonuclease